MDKIDFVLPWVDGSDSAWIKQRNEYLGIKNDQTQDSRFRDWENLQYWFRGVEKFAPWVNHITEYAADPRFIRTVCIF